MSNIKFGIGQFGSPAPKGWRQFERAFIIAILPALGGLVSGWGIEDPEIERKLLLVIPFLGSLIKGIGMCLGNGQEYSDKEVEVKTDEQQPESK